MKNIIIIIGVLLGIWFLTSIVGNSGKYEGMTAEEWAGEYYSVADCVESAQSYLEKSGSHAVENARSVLSDCL